MSQGVPHNTDQRRPDWAALPIAAVLLVLAGVIAWDASHLKVAASYARIGPQTFPFVIAGFLAVLGVWTVFAAWRGEFPEREKDEIAPIIWVIGGLAAQMLLLKVAGFSIATGILFALTARAFGQRKLHISLPFGIVLAFVIFGLFAKLLQLSLPAGPLEHAIFG